MDAHSVHTKAGQGQGRKVAVETERMKESQRKREQRGRNKQCMQSQAIKPHVISKALNSHLLFESQKCYPIVYFYIIYACFKNYIALFLFFS